MELFDFTLSGFKKFHEPSTLKTSGKLLAILGANEAGKSSLLAAMQRIHDQEPFSESEKSHDLDDTELKLSARFYLSDLDRELAKCGNARWFRITKLADGFRKWEIVPRFDGREIDHRSRLNELLAEIEAKPKTVDKINEISENLLGDLRESIDELASSSIDASKDVIGRMKAISDDISAIDVNLFPKYVRIFLEEYAKAALIESEDNGYIKAGNILVSRMPKFLLFGSDERSLKSSYLIDEIDINNAPIALDNLMRVADCELVALVNANAAGDRAKVDTLIDAANERLEIAFRSVWQQSAITVVISLSDQTLSIQIKNPNKRRTDFAERSDGLRQFVALQSFTTCRGESDPILLIDEAEQHLHYDAQADLVQMLATQTVSPKVIYTTHSAGCLPEDLGNGVRLVKEIDKDSPWSRVDNKFWNSEQTTFSPLLIGMGASAMAFFPTRSAVVVEGESDMLLYPSMFKQALEKEVLGFQFVPGLSRVERSILPQLSDCGRDVCYLVDGDDGGAQLRRDLIERGIKASEIFSLSRSGGSCELEDFIDSKLFLSALDKILSAYSTSLQLPAASSLPQYGKWRAVSSLVTKSGRSMPPKPDFAYMILDHMDSEPDRVLLDARSKRSFAKLAGSLSRRFEKQNL